MTEFGKKLVESSDLPSDSTFILEAEPHDLYIDRRELGKFSYYQFIDDFGIIN